MVNGFLKRGFGGCVVGWLLCCKGRLYAGKVLREERTHRLRFVALEERLHVKEQAPYGTGAQALRREGEHGKARLFRCLNPSPDRV